MDKATGNPHFGILNRQGNPSGTLCSLQNENLYDDDEYTLVYLTFWSKPPEFDTTFAHFFFMTFFSCELTQQNFRFFLWYCSKSFSPLLWQLPAEVKSNALTWQQIVGTRNKIVLHGLAVIQVFFRSMLGVPLNIIMITFTTFSSVVSLVVFDY